MRSLNYILLFGSVTAYCLPSWPVPKEQNRLQAPLQYIGSQSNSPIASTPCRSGCHNIVDHHSLEYAPLGDTSKSIYELLNSNDKFSYVVKAINFTGDYVDILNDSSAKITFFAPPNWAIKLPHHHDDDDDDFRTLTTVDSSPYDFATAVREIDGLEQLQGGDGDKHKERRRNFLKLIIRGLLSYHILPTELRALSLSENTTHATNLTLGDGSNGGQPLRIRVSTGGLKPRLTVNFFSHIVWPDVEAKNGVLHTISFPLLPPPSAFQELFQGPSLFSTLTSALQRVGLTDAIDLHHDGGHSKHGHHNIGTNATTVFAPTNRAFLSLPRKLQIFLFSPFGARALRKLLEFHIVPDFVLHSDYAFNASASSNRDASTITRQTGPHGEPILDFTLTLPTLLANHSLTIHISKYNFSIPFPGPDPPPPRIITKVVVNGVPAVVADIPSRNGAVHVLSRIINPCSDNHSSHSCASRGNINSGSDQSDFEGNEWEGWEDWLPTWANIA